MANQEQSEHPQSDFSDVAETKTKLPTLNKHFMIVMAIMVVSAATGNILLKYSTSGSRGASMQSILDLPQAVLTTLSNLWLELAVIFLIIQFISLIYALRLAPFSIVIPMRGGANYLIVALLAKFFLGEQVTYDQWIALVIIFIGVTMIAISKGKS